MIILHIKQENDDALELARSCQELIIEEGHQCDLHFDATPMIFSQPGPRAAFIASLFFAGVLFGAAIAFFIINP